MLSNCLIWIYIFFTTYALGTGLLRLLKIQLISDADENLYHTEDICITGFMAATVYAQVFSLFTGVGLVANIILVLFSVLIFAGLLKGKGNNIRSSLSNVFSIKTLILIVVILIMAYGASRGYFHYDSDLYHGQSIRWIEEYGVVKGLGLLHGRLAYNSSSFAVQALYSFSWLGGLSTHSCAGFVALLVMISSLRIFHVFKDRKFLVSDFCRLSAIYYILNIYDEMNSPASDYFTMLLFFYIIIRMADGAESKADPDHYGICALLAFYDMTVKLSAAPLCMITLIPFVMLVKKREVKKIMAYAVSVICILVPFFVRNYIISGRLFYPSTAFDIFNPDWKINTDAVVSDAAYIIAFGRGYSHMGAAQMSFSEWFPHWFGGIGKTWMLFFALGIAGVCLWMTGMILTLRKKENRSEKDLIINYTILTVLVSFGFWLFSSPLVRYGQGYLLLLPIITFGWIFCQILGKIEKKKAGRFLTCAAMVFFALFLGYKGVMLSVYMKSVAYAPYYVLSQDYGHYDTYPVNIGGECIVYIPVSGDQTGYDPFPTAPTENDLPVMRDPEAKDFSQGFKKS